MMRHIDIPWLLALAALLPLATIVAFVYWYRRRRARLSALGAPAMDERIVPPVAMRPPRLRGFLLALAAAFVGVAFAGPRWGAERTVVRSEGIDIVLALDASLSMLATDERPNRLERMKQEVRRFRANAQGDRIALVAFAGRSYILTPLTSDNGALDLFLDNLDPSVVGQAGSSLARAIRQGTDLLLATKTGSDRALILMSDGEAFEPIDDVRAAAARAAENGISLVTVGYGSEQGATLPVRQGNVTVDKRDENGAVVVSRYHPEFLEAAATAAQGTFIAAPETDKAGKTRQALSRLRTQARAVETGRGQTPRFQLFLLPALLLVLLETLLAERHGQRRRAPMAAATAAAASLVFLLLAPRAAYADPADDAARAYRAGRYASAAAIYKGMLDAGNRDPRTLYNYGTALLAADSLRQAAEALERVGRTRDEELQYRALFNLGLAHLKSGLAAPADSGQPALDAALAAYKKVLLARPRDVDAKWNYELALRKKRGGGGGGGGGEGESQSQTPDPSPRQPVLPRPSGGLGQQRAEQLLDNAGREEREVQRDKQDQNRPEPPPGGKDW